MRLPGPNRHHFIELAEQEFVRAQRNDKWLSMLLLDFDKSKEINDQHGHQTGHHVLRLISEILQKTLRSIDIAGRMGGEEFAIPLPETEGGQALDVAECLHQNLSGAVIHLYKGGTLGMTASIGVASRRAPTTNVDQLLSLADNAMHQAKRVGRTRVCNAGAE